MSRRNVVQRAPELESLDKRQLLSTAAPPLDLAAEAAHVVPAFDHAVNQTRNAGPVLHELCKRRGGSTAFSLVPVSEKLSSPEARVQVDNVSLDSRTIYNVAALEVINRTGTTIAPNRFSVSVFGSSFSREFPARAWGPGQVQLFFATTSTLNFTFSLAGKDQSIPPNIYPDLMYNPATFTALLHGKINSPTGIGGRFALRG